MLAIFEHKTHLLRQSFRQSGGVPGSFLEQPPRVHSRDPVIPGVKKASGSRILSQGPATFVAPSWPVGLNKKGILQESGGGIDA